MLAAVVVAETDEGAFAAVFVAAVLMKQTAAVTWAGAEIR